MRRLAWMAAVAVTAFATQAAAQGPFGPRSEACYVSLEKDLKLSRSDYHCWVNSKRVCQCDPREGVIGKEPVTTTPTDGGWNLHPLSPRSDFEASEKNLAVTPRLSKDLSKVAGRKAARD
ncbi:hypothetical protein [Caulobacter sp.]|uniref:hypothetical protein n=1 Tax=Caulobacter sp. TaxID=78 RepID=UPI001AFE3478|nr:hypothetical protein [Caulobacter sp.]MBO9545343.1 hypothetical protein [Caulobacter sp.]